MLPFIVAAVVVIAIYVVWLRRRHRPTNPLDTPQVQVRSRATAVTVRAEAAIEAASAARAAAAEADDDDREGGHGVATATRPSLRDLDNALLAANRDRENIDHLLDLIGGGRDDLDDVLAGATARAESSVHDLRRVARELDLAARTSPLEARIPAAERLVADVERTWEDEAARTREHGTRIVPGVRVVPQADLEYVEHLLRSALKACTTARTRLAEGREAEARTQVGGAESLTDEAVELLTRGSDGSDDAIGR